MPGRQVYLDTTTRVVGNSTAGDAPPSSDTAAGILYKHSFDDTASTHPYVTVPDVLNINLSSSSWTNSQSSWTSSSGITGQAITYMDTRPDTATVTLNVSIASGKTVDITSFSFYDRSSTAHGYTHWKMFINGIEVGDSSILTASGPLESTGTREVSTPVENLSGNITVVLKLYDHISGGDLQNYFRLDDFVLNGFVNDASAGSGTGIQYAQNGGYRYGFNGQEKSDEIKGEGNSYMAEFWEYDPRIGRRFNTDPLEGKFPEFSPYSTFNNSPILNDDPNGAESKTIHIDENGKVLLNKKDGDNSVFVHKGGTKESVTKNYSSTNHSAGGEKIGELGGNINLNGILNNILQNHRSQMVNSPVPKLSWFELVLPGELPGNHPWDLKANTKTIFGVAWAFDEAKDRKGKPHTTFTFNFDNMLNLEFSSASDVGNFHAGYTGTYANISVASQRLFAGMGEKAKNVKDLDGKNFWGNSLLSPPFMDKKADYFWNNMGMVAGDYDKKINAAINPKPFYNIPPTYIDATHLKSPILPR